MDFPKEMRRMIHTTNPVEVLHRMVRKIIKGNAAWVSDNALMKQFYLSLMHNEKSWRRKAYGWKSIQRDLLYNYAECIEKYTNSKNQATLDLLHASFKVEGVHQT